jgi:hypothetical protein
MRILLVLFAIAVMSSCKKEIGQSPASVNADPIASNALQPLAFHATSFSSNYPMVTGKIPPFKMTKTLYSDNRVNSLKMVTRAVPNISSSAQRYYDWDYQISYTNNRAQVSGSRKLYNVSATGVRSLVTTLWSTLYVDFNSAGYCTEIYRIWGATDQTPEYKQLALSLTYDATGKRLVNINAYDWNDDPHDTYKSFAVSSYASGTIFRIKSRATIDEVNYSYNMQLTDDFFFYQPTQYAINQWYGFLEVMQWIPMPKMARTSVTLTFPSGSNKIVQSQKYINHKYDLNKNLISYTYGDNVLQKTTWR